MFKETRGKSTGRHTHFCIREDKSKIKVKSAFNYLGLPNKLGEYQAQNTNFLDLTIEEIAKKAKNGDFGNGNERIRAIEALGYDFRVIQDYVNKLVNEENQNNDLYDVALKVIRGEFGNMPKRQELLEKAGYNYREVQNEVNKILGVK